MRFLFGVLGLLTLAGSLLLPVPAAAGEPRPRSSWARLELGADLQTIFVLRNDSDFDASPPLYNENGQTVGAIATLFTPRLTLGILDTLRIHYEVELGLNYWSKQNPDQQDATAADIFVLKHRQIYGEGEFWNKQLGFRLGYSHVVDPTGLFVNHWIGAGRVYGALSEDLTVGLFAGQVPDSTFEGIYTVGNNAGLAASTTPADGNNFTRDIWIFGADARVRFWDFLELTAWVSGLYDSHLVDKTRWAIVPAVRLEAVTEGDWGASLDLVLQAGQFLGQAMPEDPGTAAFTPGDQTVVAWATQVHAFLLLWKLRLEGNLLFLSPDDAHERNTRQHAFLSSGKNRSATLMLTEDEVRDWYDNLDERVSRFEGGFFMNRAGLFVGDLKVTWDLWSFLQPALVVGAGTVLKPENAQDGVLVGIEADLVLTFPINDYVRAELGGGVLIPGAAAGRLGINTIDRNATDPMGMVEASLLLTY